MKSLPVPAFMADIPDDLTDVGSHHGNEPPPKTGQTVRAPDGPDPHSTKATPSPALFQVVQGPDDGRVTVRTFSARAEVAAPNEGDELGRYRTVEALQAGLEEAGIDGWSAVFKDAEVDRHLVDTGVSPGHPWIGQSRYTTITFFRDAEAATDFAETQGGDAEAT